MNIIALNLPRSMTADALKALFAQHGKVASSDIVMDKEKNSSKGFGFVTMPNLHEAHLAIKALHGSTVDKKTIRVKEAEERK